MIDMAIVCAMTDTFKAFMGTTSLTCIFVATIFLLRSTRSLKARTIVEASQAYFGLQGNRNIHALMAEQRADTIVGYRFTFLSFLLQILNNIYPLTTTAASRDDWSDFCTLADFSWAGIALVEFLVVWGLGCWAAKRLKERMMSEIAEVIPQIEQEHEAAKKTA